MSLGRSQRNSIIADFQNGVINPDYEVVPTKTKGKYIVRKRATPLTDEELEELQNQADEEVIEEVDEKPKLRKRTKKQSEGLDIPTTPKEKALFVELQNQLNSQMLNQINELTCKVGKLKAWKKKMKQELYV